MTISTYADLKAQIIATLNRTNITSLVPNFIQLTEGRIAYGSMEQPFQTDPLRIRAMETSSDLTVNAQTVALPTGFLQQRRLYLSGSPINRVDYLAPDLFWEKWLASTSGTPKEYTVEGENFVFGPTPDSTYTGKILYYKKFTALSADADTNWLVTNAPNVYIQGALFEAYRYTRNMEQAQAALNSFAGIINALNVSDKSDRYAGPWTARSDTDNP